MKNINFWLIFILCLVTLNSCAPSGSALLGPIFTGAKTGSIYHASLSYGTGKIMYNIMPSEIYLDDAKKLNKINKSLPKILTTMLTGVRITKYTKAITIGAIIIPNISPNLIHDLFNGVRSFEFIKPVSSLSVTI